MRDVLIKKIEELSDFAESIEENNTQIVLLALVASMYIRLDGKLAAKIQEYCKDVLMPEAKQGLINTKASMN